MQVNAREQANLTNRWTGAAGACFASNMVRRRLDEFAPPGQLKRWATYSFRSVDMPWHPFVRKEDYPLSYVVKTIRKRINDGGFTNTEAAEIRLEEIERCGHARLIWYPDDRSFRRSPLDWRSWKTIDRQDILPEHVTPSKR
jgi:hypothetical protein